MAAPVATLSSARGDAHVGLLIGLYIAMLVYPFFEEWQQRRVDKERLAKMRKHHAMLLAGVHLESHRPSGQRTLLLILSLSAWR